MSLTLLSIPFAQFCSTAAFAFSWSVDNFTSINTPNYVYSKRTTCAYMPELVVLSCMLKKAKGCTSKGLPFGPLMCSLSKHAGMPYKSIDDTRTRYRSILCHRLVDPIDVGGNLRVDTGIPRPPAADPEARDSRQEVSLGRCKGASHFKPVSRLSYCCSPHLDRREARRCRPNSCPSRPRPRKSWRASCRWGRPWRSPPWPPRAPSPGSENVSVKEVSKRLGVESQF